MSVTTDSAIFPLLTATSKSLPRVPAIGIRDPVRCWQFAGYFLPLPVGDNRPFETPLIFQIFLQILVFAAIESECLVVGRHDCPAIRFIHNGLVCRKINFAQCPSPTLTSTLILFHSWLLQAKCLVQVTTLCSELPLRRPRPSGKPGLGPHRMIRRCGHRTASGQC